MLIGIVFSLPLLAFTVYTVLTVYVDENGFVSPTSLFVKVGNNISTTHNEMPDPTPEEIAHEAQDVLQVKPDIILKVPDYVKKFLYGYQKQQSTPTKYKQRVVQELHYNLRGKRSTRLSNLEDEMNPTNPPPDTTSTNLEILEIDFIQNEGNKETDPENKQPSFEFKLTDPEKNNIDILPKPENNVLDFESNITNSESNSTNTKINKVKIKIGPRTNTNSEIIKIELAPTFSAIGNKITNSEENSSNSEVPASPGIHTTDPVSPRRNKRDITQPPILTPTSPLLPSLPAETNITSPPIATNITTLPSPPTGTNITTPPSPPTGTNITTPPFQPTGTNITTPPSQPTGTNITTPPSQPTGTNITTPPSPPTKTNTTTLPSPPTETNITTAPSLPKETNTTTLPSSPTTNTTNLPLSSTTNTTESPSTTPELSPPKPSAPFTGFVFTKASETTTSRALTSDSTTPKSVIKEMTTSKLVTNEVTTSKLVTNEVTTSKAPTNNTASKSIFGKLSDYGKSIFGKISNLGKFTWGKITELLKFVFNFTTKPVFAVVNFLKSAVKKVTGSKGDEVVEFSRTTNMTNVVEVIQPFTSKRLLPRNTNGNAEGPSQNLEIPMFSLQENQGEDENSSLFDFERYYTSLLGLFYSCPLPENLTYTFYSIKDCPTCTSGDQDQELLITCASSFLLLDPPMKIMCSLGEWRIGKNKKVVKFPTCKQYRTYKKCPQLSIENKSGSKQQTLGGMFPTWFLRRLSLSKY
ncbi:hypothetical protein WDU94_013034 [Cyamophila willieti]